MKNNFSTSPIFFHATARASSTNTHHAPAYHSNTVYPEAQNTTLQESPAATSQPHNALLVANGNYDKNIVVEKIKNKTIIKNSQKIIEGDLEIDHYLNLQSLPAPMPQVQGTLSVRNCPRLTTLPEGLTVGAHLNLSYCQSLTTLPEGLTVGGHLDLRYCTRLTTLPDGLTVGGDLNLHGCHSLKTLPNRLTMGGDLILSSCTNLTSLPNGLTVDGDLILSSCTNLTSLPNGLTVDGDIDLHDCTNLTSLPNGLRVGGDIDLHGCTNLTTFPEDIRKVKDLTLSGCTRLTKLPNNLHVEETLDLENCVGITTLPKGLTIEGDLILTGCINLTALPNTIDMIGNDLYLTNCTSITELPEWVFHLNSQKSIHCTNTGISLNRLADYNSRQNSPEYRGPRLQFSINDYQSTINVCAENLTSIISNLGHAVVPAHPLWDYAKTQSGPGSAFNSLAIFLTRLWNEFPDDYHQNDLTNTLKKVLIPLFQKMESEYAAKNADMTACTLINGVLSIACESTETCVDRVKLGYVQMQLLANDNALVFRRTATTIINTVNNITNLQIVFDSSTNQWVHLLDHILKGGYSTDLQDVATYTLRRLHGLKEDNFTDFCTLSIDELMAHVYMSVSEISPHLHAPRVGDQIEDTLQFIYALLPEDIHKIDMRYTCCCTLTDSSDSNGPMYKTAAIKFIENACRDQSRAIIRDLVEQRFSLNTRNTTQHNDRETAPTSCTSPPSKKRRFSTD